MKKIKYLLRILSFFIFAQLHAQNQRQKLDSLLHSLSGKTADTTRIKSLIKTCYHYNLLGSVDSANYFAEEAVTLANKNGQPRFIVLAILQKANNYKDNGKFTESEKLVQEAIATSEKSNYELGKASAYATLAVINTQRRNYNEGEKYYLMSIDIYRKLNLLSKVSGSYNSLGVVLTGKGDYKKAIGYFFMAASEAKRDSNYRLIAMVNLNLGEIYAELKDYDKAMSLYGESFKNYIVSGDIRGKALVVGNIGRVLLNQKKYAEAAEILDSSIVISRRARYVSGWMGSQADKASLFLELAKLLKEHKMELNDANLTYFTRKSSTNAPAFFEAGIRRLFSTADSMYALTADEGMNSIYTHLKAKFELLNGNYKKSIPLLASSLAAARSSNDILVVVSCYYELSEAYAGDGQFEKSHLHLKRYLTLKDSLSSDEKNKAILKSQAEYEFKEKEDAIREEQEREKILFEAEKQQQGQQKTFLVIVLLLVSSAIVFTGFAYRRKAKDNKIITFQKSQIENQKNLVDEKNREVMDSITYAKRLQDAILPSEKEIKQNLPESFVFYKPKDIVAGDFYWMQTVSSEFAVHGSEKSNELQTPNAQHVLIAAADSTGHGVPGAMVSVVCSNALNSTVKEFGITRPAKILDKCRALVVETFEKNDSQVKDGMDISLCAIPAAPENGSYAIQWAGANNPLWYFKNGEFCEIKPDKQPVGKSDEPFNFTSHTIQLNKGDTLYLFSDGFSDQFGGPEGKKFKSRQFIHLLSSVQNLSMEKQKERISEEFSQWKGKIEQVDDVLIIGIKI